MAENILKVIGSANLPEELEIETEYDIKLTADCTKIEKASDHEGGFDYIYKLKLIRAEVVDKKGKSMPARARGSMSKQLRSAIYSIWHGNGDFEDYYEAVMKRIMIELDKILETDLSE